MVAIEDNRSRRERRAIATRAVTPEQLGLAGAEQLVKVERTRSCPGSAFVAENLSNPAALAAKLDPPATFGRAPAPYCRDSSPPEAHRPRAPGFLESALIGLGERQRLLDIVPTTPLITNLFLHGP